MQRLIILVLLTLGLAGCTVGSSPSPEPMPIPVAVPSYNQSAEIPIESQPNMQTCESPGILELSMFPGAIADTWVEDGYVVIGTANVPFKKNEPMSIFLYNNFNRPLIFHVSYQDAPDLVNHCAYTGKDYSIAPAGAASWVKISNEAPVVNVGCVRAVPFSIVIPKDAQCPKQWEFRIHCTPLIGAINPGMDARILITMQ